MLKPYSSCLARILGKGEGKDGGSSSIEEDPITAFQRERDCGFSWGLPSKEHRRPWGWSTKCLWPWTIQEMETSTSHRQQTRKEMTRTAINKSCKQFNKMCFCYPTVNTSWYPSTPHKGVDGDTRPVNNSFLPSRVANSLCKKLQGM